MLPSRTSVEQSVHLSPPLPLPLPLSLSLSLINTSHTLYSKCPYLTLYPSHYILVSIYCAHSCLNVLLHLILYVGINVPRSRFLPVKKTSDLLVVMSNLFQLRDGTLVQNQARLYPELPLVKLGEHFFMKV